MNQKAESTRFSTDKYVASEDVALKTKNYYPSSTTYKLNVLIIFLVMKQWERCQKEKKKVSDNVVKK